MAEEKKIATGYIGNALRSAADNHTTTFADEIFDTERQEYQSEVNGIVGTYIENPEFLFVKTDAEGRLLWWIEKDGTVNWSKGVPQPIQVKLQELEQKIKDNADDDKTLVERVTANEAAIVAINKALSNYKVEVAEALSKKMDGEYIENPKYVHIMKDAEDRIICAIEADGNIYYGAGVPQQIIDYIEKKFAEYEDIVVFLKDLEKGDKTLQTLLNEKVDKEEGSSLIPSQYIQEIESYKFIHLETDDADRIFGGRKKDGTKFETVGFETPYISVGGQVAENYADKEDRIELNTDCKGRIFSYRDKDGVLHENAGLFSKGINIPYSIKELQEFQEHITIKQSPRFIQISDPHNYDGQTVENGVNAEGRMALLANMINDENKNGNLDFVICTGDCCLTATKSTGERDNNLSLFKERIIDKVPTIFLPVVGNHDSYTDEEWYNCFKLPKQYSATVDQCYLIVLNVYRESTEWAYLPNHSNADEKGYVPCSILVDEGVSHSRDFRFTTVDTDFLEEQLKIATKLGRTPIVCYHTFDITSAVDEVAAAASVATARSLINNYDCKLILYGHNHIIQNKKADNQWHCNPGWFGPINAYKYNVSPWAINLFENKDNYFSVTNVVLEHDYPDSNPEYHYLPGGAIGHIEGSRTTTNLWESNDKRSMFNF